MSANGREFAEAQVALIQDLFGFSEEDARKIMRACSPSLAVFAAAWAVKQKSRRKGKHPQAVWNCLMTLISGSLSSRNRSSWEGALEAFSYAGFWICAKEVASLERLHCFLRGVRAALTADSLKEARMPKPFVAEELPDGKWGVFKSDYPRLLHREEKTFVRSFSTVEEAVIFSGRQNEIIEEGRFLVWDHWEGVWRSPENEDERECYLPSKEGQLFGETAGSLFTRSADQRLSDFTGRVEVKSGADWGSSLEFVNGELASGSPDSYIVAGFIAVRLGQGATEGKDYGREWKVVS